MMVKPGIARYLIKVSILFIAYFVTARIGLSFDAVSGFATLVWPPTGISLAALLIYGYKMWPGIFLAAFLVNFSVGASVLTALGIAVGNTIGPLFAAYAYKRIARDGRLFDHLKNILGLILFGGVASTMISASVGANSLLFGGAIETSAYGSVWTAWWIGDMLGILLIAPLILTWREKWRVPKPEGNKRAEAWLIFISIILVSLMSFWDLLKDGLHDFPASISYLVFPPLIWAALRFSPRLVTTAIVVLSGLAIWGTANGFGPFAAEMLSRGLLYLQVYIASTAVTMLILTAVVSERRTAEEILYKLNQELERRVQERTRQLDEYNKNLKQTVAERTQELEEKVTDLEKLNRFMVGRELKMIELKEGADNLRLALDKALRSNTKRKSKK